MTQPTESFTAPLFTAGNNFSNAGRPLLPPLANPCRAASSEPARNDIALNNMATDKRNFIPPGSISLRSTMPLTRRSLIALPLALSAQTKSLRIDTHVHLFSGDTNSFPFHKDATYKPSPAPMESYAAFARQAGIDHAVIVHPEPYQDDHSYLEYCFAHEPSKGFFKGTCLFDAFRPDTPARIDALTKRWPDRVRALRVHRTQIEALTSGPIHDRPLDAPQMLSTWKAAASKGLMIQMHFIPAYAVQIAKLAQAVPDAMVILDHLGRNGMGTAAEWPTVVALAKHGNTIMKFSGVNYSSRQPWPHRDAMPRVRQLLDAFGPDRMIWGGLGMNMEEFKKANEQFGDFFAFTTAANRNKIKGGTAMRLFGW